jgi:predicted TIM-barrel fold metal-dependent hydrolase
MDGAEKIMKRYIVDAPESVVKNTIMHSLTSPNICTEWLWEHKHTTFKQLMKTSLMEDTLEEYRLEGVIWLMEHGLILTERQMSYIDEVEEDHEDTPEYHTSLVNKIKELYAAQARV